METAIFGKLADMVAVFYDLVVIVADFILAK